MPEISNLTRPKPVSVTIDLGDGDAVLLEFDANRVTPAWVRDTERRVEERDTLSLPKALADVILGWDVTEDGQPFEPSADNIAVLSFPAMSSLFARVMEAAVPSSEEGNDSSATSPTASIASMPQPEPRPSGEPISGSQNASALAPGR